jgi:2-phospho-L-lactate guanylyltransferase
MTSAAADLVELAARWLRPVCSVASMAIVRLWRPGSLAVLVAVILHVQAGRCRDELTATDTIGEMCSRDIDHWCLVVPVKCQRTAKSRLHPPAGVARPELAHAIALDTITAALAAIAPAHLVVVTSDEHTAAFVRDQGAVVVPDPGQGLNPAIRLGIDYVDRTLGTGPTAVLLGDIPALRPQDLIDALRACARHPRALVPDASGAGTVLLTARSPRDLNPRFGPDSARRHSSDCRRLDLELPALRTDVDDDLALSRAISLGVGWHTAVVLGLPPTRMD